MRFKKIYPYGPNDYIYWFSGIYKIVSYRKGEYLAYFIKEWMKNWGDNVVPESKMPHTTANGTKCFRTLKDAQMACELHSKEYVPSESVKARAAEIVADYVSSTINRRKHHEH